MSKSWIVMSRNSPPKVAMYAAGAGAGSRLVMTSCSSRPISPLATRVAGRGLDRVLDDGQLGPWVHGHRGGVDPADPPRSEQTETQHERLLGGGVSRPQYRQCRL